METRTLIEQAMGIIIIAQQHSAPRVHPSPYCPSSTAMGTSDRILTGYGVARRCRSASLPVSDVVVLWLSSPEWTRPSAIRIAADGRERQRRPARPARQAAGPAGRAVRPFSPGYLVDGVERSCRCQRCELQERR